MTTRRTFLRSLGAGVVLAAGSPILGRETIAGEETAALVERIRARVRSIASCDLRFAMTVLEPRTGWGDAELAIVNGPGMITFDGTTYTARYPRDGFTIVERARADWFEQVMETDQGGERVLYSGSPSVDHRVRFSLRQFLPTPTSRRVHEHPVVLLRGEHVRRLEQDNSMYFVDSRPRVIRWTQALGNGVVETTDYDGFVDATDDVPFPTRITSQRGDKSALVLTVDHVDIQLNPAAARAR